ncbi:hypothetical protein NE848_16835 [Gramella jeungdoensis]|uniref:CYTH domain-containing protein n=1 Tax=Gramella jeungdoensis TaxID=708091 RepID=A0ABT0Z5R4_9FLAO|nr:hypothetical protein [Gramella jeungdoensis]MCM8571066.1 hypothetical protein [Gramella jeungdoensis]
MFNSKEIRWFGKKEDKEISSWFAGRGITFENTEPRTDFYLPLPGKKDIGIKLREGNIEIKHLLAKPEKGKLSAKAHGYFERYTKWSFSTEKDDVLSHKIIQAKEYDWLEVQKERMGCKLMEGSNGIKHLVKIEDQIPYGCQLEYTRIKLNNTTWYTFGLEWFGEKEIEVGPELVEKILGNSTLNGKNSMGYAEFLNMGKL